MVNTELEPADIAPGRVVIDFDDIVPDQLAGIFSLPENTPQDYIQFYQEIVDRMRAEASGFPMNTVQILLIERIAYNYVVLRMKENGFMAPFARANEQKDFNTFWLTMTQEFNRVLSSGQDKVREKLFKDIVDVIKKVVRTTVEDPILRDRLLKEFSDEFKVIGL